MFLLSTFLAIGITRFFFSKFYIFIYKKKTHTQEKVNEGSNRNNLRSVKIMTVLRNESNSYLMYWSCERGNACGVVREKMHVSNAQDTFSIK